MVPQSGPRFSDQTMLLCESMVLKSGSRFSDKTMLQEDR
jgi:hypothetical protein